MKKISFLLVFCISAFIVSAQISVNDIKSDNGILKAYEKITSNKDTVFVVLFNGIISNTDITYKGFGTNVNWYKYTDLVTPTRVGTKDIYPDDATGYVLEVDGKRRAVWVIDYKKYLCDLKSIEPDLQSINQCNELNLLIDAVVPKLTYQTLSGIGDPHELPRIFNITYNTLKWENDAWITDDSPKFTLQLPVSHFNVTIAPLCNTKFKLYGDQYAADLKMDFDSVSSTEYQAVAVKCHIVGTVSARKELNEMSMPEDKSPISYSVPIDVQFLSNPNLHVIGGSSVPTYFNWTIYKDGQLIVSRNDRDHRYTFLDYGTYTVKLVASNATCTYTDSITVNAYDADIQVPNVFTPNGDGMNDEFRVAYKSLLAFECWVYNRWGRKVFYWNDPQKGWDGKINGKEAPESAYFYVIKATGYGLDPKTKHNPKIKSTITLKGDINLLRGGNQ